MQKFKEPEAEVKWHLV